jgi:hypothetical protein
MARYVMLRGVLAFALIGAAVVLVFWYTRSYSNTADLWTMGIAYPFLGLAAGYVNWTLNERRYRIVTGRDDTKK